MRVIAGYTFFWRTKEVFSNWNMGDFVVNDIRFNCAEQWMMYSKAMLFGDTEIAARILAETRQNEMKALGRKVRGYIDAVWQEQAEDLMYPGLRAKFTQDARRLEQLLATEGTLLVEAAPNDTIWGIGLEESDPRCLDPQQWKGLNKLGKVLTRLRDDLLAERRAA